MDPKRQRFIFFLLIVPLIIVGCNNDEDDYVYDYDPSDTTPPAVTYTSRSDGALDAAVNTDVLVALSEPIRAQGSLAGLLTVRAEDGTAIAGEVSYDSDKPALRFTLSQELKGGYRYVATLSGETRDLAGNPLGQPYRWKFTVDGKRRDSDAERQLQLTLDGAAYEYAIPGALMAVRTSDGRIWTTSSGYADRDQHAPMMTDMHFRIGSNTKTLVATAVLQLVDQGLVRLDDPVNQYLANEMAAYMTAYDGNQITVRQLLNHTSGIFNFTADAEWGNAFLENPEKQYDPPELLRIANRNASSPNAPVYGQFSYSNTNYVLLGLLLYNVTGVIYEDAMRLWITNPLSLVGTYAPNTGELDMMAPYSHGYWEDTSTGILYDYTRSDPSSVWASGNMVSTISDLVVWGTHLGQGTLLSAPTQAERLKFVAMSSTLEYGLGIVRDKRVNLIGHQGGMIGYTSQVYYLPEENATLAFFYNRTLALHDYSEVMTFDALKILWPARFSDLEITRAPAELRPLGTPGFLMEY